MNKRLDQLASIQFVVVIGIVHFEIMELKFLITHFASVDGDIHMLSNVAKIRKDT